MAISPLGLGKGLDALIRETSEAREKDGVRNLPLNDIQPNPNQPRRRFNEKALEELAASIRSQGVLQPLLVRPVGPAQPGKYEIVAGERRWRASKLAGLKEVPVLVRSFSAEDTLAAALIENLQREDLNPIEEAMGLQMLKEEFGLSQEDLSRRIGKSRPAIANSLRLLSLPENIRADLVSGALSSGHARALLGITDAPAQQYLRNLILEEHLSVRETEGFAATWKETGAMIPDARLNGAGGAPDAEPETGADQASPKAAKVARPQSARLLDIQHQLGASLNASVKVTGKEDKGKISIAYASREELDLLLQRLSVPALEGAALAPLSGAVRDSLTGRDDRSLSGVENAALSGSGNEALAAGESRSALDAGTPRASLRAESREALAGREQAALHTTSRLSLAGQARAVLSGSVADADGDPTADGAAVGGSAEGPASASEGAEAFFVSEGADAAQASSFEREDA